MTSELKRDIASSVFTVPSLECLSFKSRKMEIKCIKKWMRDKPIFWGRLVHIFNSGCHTQLHILSLLSQAMCSSGDETCDLTVWELCYCALSYSELESRDIEQVSGKLLKCRRVLIKLPFFVVVGVIKDEMLERTASVYKQ